MTQVGIYGEIYPEPLQNPSGFALGISLGLRLYFTVYPSSRNNTDTVFSAWPSFEYGTLIGFTGEGLTAVKDSMFL